MPTTINEVLPRELLAYIFESGSQDDSPDKDSLSSGSELGDETGEPAEESQAEFAELVSHVCRHWRDVALSTPTLWSNIQIHDQTAFEWLKQRISLTKEVALDVQVELSGELVESPEDVMYLLRGEVRRWREFDCTLHSNHATEAFLTQLRGLQAPLLENFTLVDDSRNEFSRFYRPSTVYELFDGPGSLPKLRTVSLWSIPVKWDANPFQTLSELELCYMPD
ncbi:hypothetical protein FRB90_007785, partial [Tulasnella sp. 427]